MAAHSIVSELGRSLTCAARAGTPQAMVAGMHTNGTRCGVFPARSRQFPRCPRHVLDFSREARLLLLVDEHLHRVIRDDLGGRQIKPTADNTADGFVQGHASSDIRNAPNPKSRQPMDFRHVEHAQTYATRHINNEAPPALYTDGAKTKGSVNQSLQQRERRLRQQAAWSACRRGNHAECRTCHHGGATRRRAPNRRCCATR